jgi:hypothetical protein
VFSLNKDIFTRFYFAKIRFEKLTLPLLGNKIYQCGFFYCAITKFKKNIPTTKYYEVNVWIFFQKSINPHIYPKTAIVLFYILNKYRLLHGSFHIIPFISLRFMISAREPTGSRDDIWTRADKGYDMKNDMLWYVYHILQQRK